MPAAWKIGSRNGGIWKLSMKKLEAPPIADCSANGSDGVSVEGATALCFARSAEPGGCSPAGAVSPPVSVFLAAWRDLPGRPLGLALCACWACTCGGAGSAASLAGVVSVELVLVGTGAASAGAARGRGTRRRARRGRFARRAREADRRREQRKRGDQHKQEGRDSQSSDHLGRSVPEEVVQQKAARFRAF